MRAFSIGAFSVCFCVLAGIAAHVERNTPLQEADAEPPQQSFRPVVPRTWAVKGYPFGLDLNA